MCISFCSVVQILLFLLRSGFITLILILIFVIPFCFQGGRSTAYKNSVLQKSDTNGCPGKDGVALFRVQGPEHGCVQAIQVELVRGKGLKKFFF
jgi:hypothetical protein